MIDPQLVDAIYEWVEDAITNNIKLYFKPTFIEDCKQEAVEHFSEIIRDYLISEHHTTNDTKYIGLYHTTKPPKKLQTDKDDNSEILFDEEEDHSNTFHLGEAVQIAIDDVLNLYKIPPRSILEEDEQKDELELNLDDKEIIINTLNNIKYPAQRSPEWYESRQQLFSASSIYKLFGSISLYNSLIYEKCNPQLSFNGLDTGACEATDPRTWGVKYEPLSAAIYMRKNPGTVVRTNYGCIRHPTYLCIGASPDGINVSQNNPAKYGRMVEIKNIVNRDITGIPKWEYWIQMQIQMEVCGLTKCDFVETRFNQYHSANDFYSDTEAEYKGVILYFVPIIPDPTLNVNPDIDTKLIHFGTPELNQDTKIKSIFVYMPLYVRNESWAIQSFIEEQCEHYKKTHTLNWTTYWCLDEYSCVCVDHNIAWCQEAVKVIVDAWDVVEKEKSTGASTRAPKRRTTTAVTKCMF